MVFAALPLAAASTPDANTLFLWEAVLDVVGVIAAIWTLWIFAWLPLKGIAMSAFRLIAIGGVIFAFLHVLDTLFSVWTVLPKGLPGLVHFGLVLVSLVLFVLGLARLADAVTAWQRSKEQPASVRWWQLAVALALVLLATSFIIYGFDLLAVVWAAYAIDAGIIVLSITCAFQVWRARLGGAVGGALYLALIGLLIFSLAHPTQTWLAVAQIVSGPIGPLLHRLVVIPAFLLFSASIARLSRALTPKMAQPAIVSVSKGAS
jgi:uncharacterized membrane protein YidH (DUF202 family)